MPKGKDTPLPSKFGVYGCLKKTCVQSESGEKSTMFSSVGQKIKENGLPPKEVGLMSSRMALNDHKAGMQNLDREKINQIIYEASKGSKFFENEKKKDEQVNQRIAEQQRRIARIPEFELAAAEKEADVMLEYLEQMRNLKRTIVHIDMDAFYAAVETRDNPSLQHKPMAVGSKSMLSTSNYIARRFGVRAAMPGFIGKKLCPQLVIIPPDFKKYTAVSRQVRSILVQYDENFCSMSLDEAYLDFTGHLEIRKHFPEDQRTVICRTCDNLDTTYCLCDPNLPQQLLVLDPHHDDYHMSSKVESSSESLLTCHENSSVTRDTNAQTQQKRAVPKLDKDSLKGKKMQKNLCSSCRRPIPGYKPQVFGFSAEDAVREMRCKIEQRTQLTASAGIAPNTLIAKICSDRNKPNGQFCISYSKEAIMEFMRDLPIRKVCGIGKVTDKMLHALDVVTCSHLYKQRGLLYILYSETSFEHFMQVSLGIGSTRVERDSERKSLSTEQTFIEISKPSEQYAKCLQLCDSLASDLHNEGLLGRTITVKLKTVDFDVKTRSQSVVQHTDNKETIYQVASELIKTEIAACSPKPFRLRLMGVRISNFLPKTRRKKQDRIDCFIKKNLPLSSDCESDKISLSTEPNRTIPGAVNSPLPDTKPLAESPTGHYCPICNRKCPTDLRIFNAHIDKCLLGGKNSRSSRKRLSPTLNKDSFTESASQSVTPFKANKQCRGRTPKKKMAQITLDMVSSQESFATQGVSGNRRETLTETDVVVINSDEEVNPLQELDSPPPSPVFGRSSEMKCSIREAQQMREGVCIETIQITSSEMVANLAEEGPFPCNVPASCFDKDQQNINISQSETVTNSTLSLHCAGNRSVRLESFSLGDPKTKNSHLDKNDSKGVFPIKESWDKVSKSVTNSLENAENMSDENPKGNPTNEEDSSKEESPILQPVQRSEAANRLSPQAKVMSFSELGLKDQKKKTGLQMLQKCPINAATVDRENPLTFPEKRLTEIKKMQVTVDSTSPSKKKSSSKEKSSKSVKNLLQYFNPTVAQTFVKNSNVVQQISLIETQAKTSSPSKSHISKILTTPLCLPKEENPTEQVLSQSNWDGLEMSSNKMLPLDSDVIALSDDALPTDCQPEICTSLKSKSNSCDENDSHQTNVSILSSHIDNSNTIDGPPSQVINWSTVSSLPDQSTLNSYDETPQVDSTTSLTANSMQPLASPDYEVTDESKPSSQENFSQPFQEALSYKEADEESACLSENKPEISLQNSRQPVKSPDFIESQEDADAVGETFTCPVCSMELSASDMTLFNEHVDLCLNQSLIHNILIDEGKEINKAETMKRRADLLSPLLKSKKKKKYKNDSKNNKDPKMLTLHSFFN